MFVGGMAPDLQPAIIYYVLPDNYYVVNDSTSFRNRQLKQGSRNRRQFGFHRGFLVKQVMDSGKSSSSHNPTSMELEEEEESCIKNTMQMHEHIFKQQVRELHRLYSVQKLLMDEVKKQQMEGTTATLWRSPLLTSSSDATSFINLPNKQPHSGNLDLERPCKEEITAIDDELLEDDQVVELTLSIGRRKMDGKRSCIDSQLLTESDRGGSVSGAETETSKANKEEEKKKKKKKKQPFLFL